MINKNKMVFARQACPVPNSRQQLIGNPQISLRLKANMKAIQNRRWVGALVTVVLRVQLLQAVLRSFAEYKRGSLSTEQVNWEAGSLNRAPVGMLASQPRTLSLRFDTC